ncbi:MAG: hypothetical protein ACXADY_08935 [Candidatus Hodarchaeales archaeon]
MSKVSESTDNAFKQLEMARELERVRFELTESSVSVKFLQNFLGFSFEGISIPSYSKGSQIEIPYFLAEILRKKSVIEDFRMNFPITLQDLEGTVRKEVRVGELQPLHPYFYILLKDLVLLSEDKDSQFSELEQKRQKTKFNQLTHERISKLVKMTDSRKVLAQKKKNLTSSEQVLFEKIVDWIQNWKAAFVHK